MNQKTHPWMFGPEAVSIINRAYESALTRLGDGTPHFERRADLAKHMLDLACAGETDEQRLCDGALARLSRDFDSFHYTGF